MRHAALASALAAMAGAAWAEPAGPTPEPPEAIRQVALARASAGEDLTRPLYLCRADAGLAVQELLGAEANDWLEPVRVFDDLYFIGSRFVGVWVLRTGDGLIMFDAGASVADMKDGILPRLRVLGLDPADIRYAVVTHGHWDHYGGAPYLQETFGTRIVLSEADWRLLEKAPADGMEKQGRPTPRRDVVAVDGQALRLGGARVVLHLTPGHTPGTLSALVPVRDGARRHVMSLLGGTAFPPVRGPNNRTGGQAQFDRSVKLLRSLSLDALADGVISAHAFADGGLERMAALKARAPGAPHPFVIGPAAVGRYYDVFHHCLQAAMARPEGDGPWARDFDEAAGVEAAGQNR